MVVTLKDARERLRQNLNLFLMEKHVEEKFSQSDVILLLQR